MTAIFSPDGLYRYRLERDLGAIGATRGAVAFLMLNPSTADATADDPTIRRCIGYARLWGYRRLVVGNAYAWRSTDPAGLWTSPDPVGAPLEEGGGFWGYASVPDEAVAWWYALPCDRPVRRDFWEVAP